MFKYFKNPKGKIRIIKRFLRYGIYFKKELPMCLKDLKSEINENRQILNNVVSWIDNETYSNSYFDYGIPDSIKHLINLQINNLPTYTDMMLKMRKLYFSDINQLEYLELGVSVGKNLLQVINNFENATFVGFEIEEINPAFEKKLGFRNKVTWQGMVHSIKTKDPSLTLYEYKKKNVTYLSADILDENSWQKLSGHKFNIIFSDALHTPEALDFEILMIKKYNLLSEKFIIIWDDVDGEMQKTLFKIAEKNKKSLGLKSFYLIKINGWIGQHEHQHSVGILSNFVLQ